MATGHRIAREALFEQVVSVIKDGEPLTLRGISERSGLCRTTARKYVSELETAGAIVTRQLEGRVTLYSVLDEEPVKARTLAD
jgi:DNA-binding IclR family transcriptional regulator